MPSPLSWKTMPDDNNDGEATSQAFKLQHLLEHFQIFALFLKNSLDPEKPGKKNKNFTLKTFFHPTFSNNDQTRVFSNVFI